MQKSANGIQGNMVTEQDKSGRVCLQGAPDIYDMDDGTPLDKKYAKIYETRITEEPLCSGIEFLNASLRELYQKSNSEALIFQNKHRIIALMAIVLGFIAIVFALVQHSACSHSHLS